MNFFNLESFTSPKKKKKSYQDSQTKTQRTKSTTMGDKAHPWILKYKKVKSG